MTINEQRIESMFAEERRLKIAEIINRGDSVKVAQLAREFSVSESTIRRDLNELERFGLILRTHGGAISTQISKLEATFVEKQDKYSNEKEKIGKNCCRTNKRWRYYYIRLWNDHLVFVKVY